MNKKQKQGLMTAAFFGSILVLTVLLVGKQTRTAPKAAELVPQSLLINGDFEMVNNNLPIGWAGVKLETRDVAISTSTDHSGGSKAFRLSSIQNSSTIEKGISQSVSNVITQKGYGKAGDTITVSVWTTLSRINPVGSTESWAMLHTTYSDGTENRQAYGLPSAPHQDWQQTKFDFVAEKPYVALEVYLYTTGKSNFSYLLDDASLLVKTTEVKPTPTSALLPKPTDTERLIPTKPPKKGKGGIVPPPGIIQPTRSPLQTF